MSRNTRQSKDPGTTRDAIVDAADRLFHQQGYGRTSFSDIADAVGISRGNFYHHFPSKDEILDAVIEARLRQTRQMLADWEAQAPDPAGRILRYIRIVATNRPMIMRHGCPVGTLCTELAKLGHPARAEAGAIFGAFRGWLAMQFSLLGHARDADALAMRVLAFSQGVAVLDNALRDKAFVEREVACMERWLANLAHAHAPA